VKLSNCLNGIALFFLLCFCIDKASAVSKQKSDKGFTQNFGQWKESFLFRTNFEQGAAFIEKNGITLHIADLSWRQGKHLVMPADGRGFRGAALKSIWLNASKNINFQKFKPCSYYENYYSGKDPRMWKTNIIPVAQLIAQSVWPKIDIEINTATNSLKTNYVLKPGAKISDIQIQYPGFHNAFIRKSDGALVFPLSFMELAEEKPFAWQWINGKKTEVKCRYTLNGNIVGFETEEYDKSEELIIDPVLVFASYTGSTADNFGFTATYDNDGRLYAGGIVFSAGYPLTQNAFDTTYTGLNAFGFCDVGISVFDSSGSNLIYSSYLGGTETEEVSSLVVNNNNELFAFGVTGSADFPVSAMAYDTSFAGGPSLSFPSNGTVFNLGTDIYVCKFSSDGTSLLASTFVGGSDNDGANNSALVYNYGDYFRGEINLDLFGNVYVGTCTYSNDFPTTNSALQTSFSGGIDGIVFKLSPQLNALTGSSYLGGSGDDAIYSVTTDDNTNVYVSGGTTSADLPVTSGAWQNTYQGGLADGFVFKLLPSFNAALGGSYTGTPEYDQCFFVQCDKNKNAYLFGQTLGNFPVTNGVYSNPGSPQFIIKFDSLISTPIYSSVFGNGSVSAGQVNISPTAFLVDVCENIYISGWGGDILNSVPTNNMPVSANAFQSTTDGFNFYLAVFEKDMQSLLYGTYFGGSTSREHVDGGTSRFDKRGIVYQSVCAGCGSNDDFPTTPGAWSQINGSTNCNNGLFKFDFQIRLAVADFSPSVFSGCAPLTVQFNNNSSNTSQFNWDFAGLGGGFANDTTFTFLNPGNYLVRLIASDSLSCNGSDTTFRVIQVTSGPQVSFSYSNTSCSNQVTFSGIASGGTSSINSWIWNFGDGQNGSGINPSHNYLSPGTYNVQLIASDATGCSDTTEQTVSFSGYTAAGTAQVQCDYQASFQLLTPGINTQKWMFNDPANPTAFSNLPNASFQFSDSGWYQVELVIYYGPGNTCTDTLNLQVYIPPPLIPGFEILQPTCNNQFILLDTSLANAPNSIAQILWLINGLEAGTDSSLNINLNSGQQNISMMVTDLQGCTDTVHTSIFVPDYFASVNLSDSVLCEPGKINLFASGGLSCRWEPAYLFDNPQNREQNININESENISVQIQFPSINGDTCVFIDSAFFEVVWNLPNNITLNANPDTITAGPDSEFSELTVSGLTGNSFSWSPDISSAGNQQSPIRVNPDTTTQYTFTTENNGACARSASVTVFVLDGPCSGGELFVPNTFTPNSDGRNDVFRPRGFGIPVLLFRIYNRWGELIFESNDINKGWDGTYKDKPSDPGVFSWYIEYSCLTGESGSIVKKGNVTLVR
jgi:gliding motility-associated-like protein